MHKIITTILVLSLAFSCPAQLLNRLPVWKSIYENSIKKDWLADTVAIKAAVYRSVDGKDIILSNGLLKRSFRLTPNLACIDFKNLTTSEQLLRAIKPEAVVTINNKAYAIGGLQGQKQNAYLLEEWLDEFTTNENDFQYTGFTVSEVQPYINWKSRSWMTNKQNPTGKQLTFTFTSNLPEVKDIVVKVHYELYDGIPLLCKWISIENKSGRSVHINQVINELLATPEEESAVVGATDQMQKPHGLYIESNYAFNNAMKANLSDQTTHWKRDTTYTSQVNYNFNTPCLLEVYPDKGIGIDMAANDIFQSIRTYELLLDSYDRERNGLAQRRMYRTIAPWTTANPIFMHLVSKNDEQVKTAIDQCAATGYEALILSFGSHCNMEDTSAANIERWKTLADYAHSKNILIGSYSLFSSRRISDEDDVIDPVTGKPDAAAFFGHAPCLGSRWGLGYLEKLKHFMSRTGFDIFENDGPYPGDVCASTSHPGHKGLADSQWRQMQLQKSLYHWCSQNGIYVNAPDWYFLDGTNKIGLGYREVNFSLPREQQMILNRQNIYDGTWEKTPAMGWGFVPLTQYHGGGAAATIEPLSEHLKAYEQLMMQYYGAGVQACYRGPRLYDTEKTKQLVINTIGWYKKYRAILNSDIIHLRRADGRDWDGIMHVNPKLKEKALVMLYNPQKNNIERSITLPLYYTGLTVTAKVMDSNKKAKQYRLDREQNIRLNVTIPAEGYIWLVVE